MKKVAWCVWAFAIAVLPAQVPSHRPKVGLVLEGGGALGFAHIGVLKYLEEHHIPVDIVAGTSMGGLVGGLYAIGESPREIEDLTQAIDWDSVMSGTTDFQDLSFRRKEDRQAFPNRLEMGLKRGITFPIGLNSGHRVGLVLDRATLAYPHQMNFDDFPTPFRCVATDITAGKIKIFDSGSISQALRATMSIPAVFSPVLINGHLYTDGGAVDNLPVDVAKQAGAEIVIAVYLDPGPSDPKAADSMLTVASKNISIMISVNELRNMKSADVLINADVHGFTSASFKEGDEIIPKGYAAAVSKGSMLSRLALNDSDWRAYVSRREAKRLHAVPVPQFVEVVGDKADYLETLQDSLQQYIGKTVDPAAVERTITRITGTGVISSANYTMTEKNGVPGLEVITHDKAFAPPFLDLAVNIDGSDPGNVLFGLAGRLTFMDLGGYRAEWRNDLFFGSRYGVQSEYYRPFTGTSKWFYAPRIYASSSPFNIYSGQDRLAQYRLERDGFGFDLGYALGRRSELRFGEDLFWFKSVKKIAEDPIPNTSQRQLQTNIRYRFLGTDNIAVPRQGFNVQTTYGYYARPGTGFSNFSLGEVQVDYFHKTSENGSLIFTANGGTSFGASTLNLLLQSFSLGGPFHLGAYGQNELLGSDYFLFQTGYEHRLLPISPLLGEGVYAMTFLEVGKMFNPINSLTTATPIDGSVALVARTSLGPIFLGASFGSDDHRKWWFGIGRIF
jgi:NTE family protein